jgi:hypothetical protein
MELVVKLNQFVQTMNYHEELKQQNEIETTVELVVGRIKEANDLMLKME